MQKNLMYKIVAIVGLTLLIVIALAMIESTIRERARFRDQAVASIATESVRQQVIAGPVLVISYDDEFEAPEAADGKTTMVTQVVHRKHLVFPNQLSVNGTVDTDRRHRGIHQVLVYTSLQKFSGDFTLPTLSELPRAKQDSRVRVGMARVALGIEDVRGIRNIPQIDFDGAKLEFGQGSSLDGLPRGMHADVGVLPLAQARRVNFAFTLGLDGIEKLDLVPFGNNNKVNLRSNWAHPQFGGRFLPSPRERVINDKGFEATWDISSLATSAQQQLRKLDASASEHAPTLAGLDSFSVGFIEPVNVYSLAERAAKYGLLFVGLTFGGFFVVEILKRLQIHPIQYLLVGLALALFFLLLVSLSEHIAFWLAYLVASLECIVLIGFYLSFVLRDWTRGFGFGAGLTLLYSALYGILISEDNALVLGSLLLFAVLAAVMVATRKVDWYAIGRSEAAA
ncbi:MAG: cell envelope integrity protein CreD [Gammaproteobacteria bacterium]